MVWFFRFLLPIRAEHRKYRIKTWGLEWDKQKQVTLRNLHILSLFPYLYSTYFLGLLWKLKEIGEDGRQGTAQAQILGSWVSWPKGQSSPLRPLTSTSKSPPPWCQLQGTQQLLWDKKQAAQVSKAPKWPEAEAGQSSLGWNWTVPPAEGEKVEGQGSWGSGIPRQWQH